MAAGLIVLFELLDLIWGTGPVLAKIPRYMPMRSTFVAYHAMEEETNLKIIPSPSVLETGKLIILFNGQSRWDGDRHAGLELTGLVRAAPHPVTS